jgi:hypothetical protein
MASDLDDGNGRVITLPFPMMSTQAHHVEFKITFRNNCLQIAPKEGLQTAQDLIHAQQPVNGAGQTDGWWRMSASKI